MYFEGNITENAQELLRLLDIKIKNLGSAGSADIRPDRLTANIPDDVSGLFEVNAGDIYSPSLLKLKSENLNKKFSDFKKLWAEAWDFCHRFNNFKHKDIGFSELKEADKNLRDMVEKTHP